ncbi:MAG: 4'-phosphopantetheinyl transferase superfamily protein [Muribaculaceae bacterium]|nr:4'-phosphopantetheinyl transferase superfamily protein [Muribaculaceae bacterium]
MTKSISIKILKHFIVDGCEVKFADVTPLAAPGALDAALRQLSHHRRDKTLRYRFERGKLLSAGVGLLLDDMLRSRGLRERDMRYVEGEHGKLAFEQYPDLHFSLSHSGTLVACAVGDVALGVDVQTIVTARESLVNYIMSDNEKAKLQTLDEEARNAYFTQLWTLKESYAKATGKGLTHDFPAFEVASDGEVRVLSALNPPARFFTTALDGAQGAVAMLEEKK